MRKQAGKERRKDRKEKKREGGKGEEREADTEAKHGKGQEKDSKRQTNRKNVMSRAGSSQPRPIKVRQGKQ